MITTKQWIFSKQSAVLLIVVVLVGAPLWYKRHQQEVAENAANSAPTPAPLKQVVPHFPIPSLKDIRDRDGMKISKSDQFWTKWKLLNVRYRTDNGEQRFVYANDIAVKAMASGASKYPDGAIFAKLGFHTQADPEFPVSLEPNSFGRMQIMEKNAKRYPDTDGWGYAVVLSIGTPPESSEDHQIAVTCHACHKLAPDRDFVFTKSPFIESAEKVASKLSSGGEFKSKFRTVLFNTLTSYEKNVMVGALGSQPKPDLPLKYYSMSLFGGSVSESTPVISKFASDDHALYLLSDPNSGHFIMADLSAVNSNVQMNSKNGCSPGTHVVMTISQSQAGLVPTHVKFGTLCGDQIRWDKIKEIKVH